MIPAQLGSQVTAALALDSIHEHRAWDPHIVQRLEFVAGIIAAGLNRTIAQRRIDALHEFEQVISRVSHRFVNLPPESVDAEIEGGLGMIAEVLDSDLTVLIQVDANNTITVTHESNSERFEGYYFKGADVRQAFPWLADRMQRRETISISNLSDFPAAAANEMEAMKQAGLEAVLFEPVEIRGELAGYIVIDSVHSREWSKHDRQQLQLLGGVFCESLARQRAELGLASAFAEINALKEQLQHENMHLRNEIELTHNHGEIIGDSPALRKALEKVVQVAATDSTVLITGETGTGKELIARAIHNNSSRRDKLMVKVNCAALPSSLVEAELFGREKGAYTGALNRELGRFEIADGSTIFLDEIGELSMELQAKLLRVLQDGEFERLGSSKTLQVDARVLTATNRDLAQAVADKEFREDLYYRLNVFPIEVPPLRMRAEDIPQLVWAFVQEFSASMGKSIESIPNATMEALTTYDWPGNVREVRNIVERAMIVSSGRVLEVGLPIAAGNREDASEQSRQSLAEVERNHILAVVKSTGWRIRGPGGAASILGLKPTTLEARMKRLGLERPEPS
jgi:transcriptional regulator with GAF, ATPase, and Fis domain